MNHGIIHFMIKILQTFKVQLVMLLTIFLWASAFVGIRIGLSGYSPGALALLRFLVASVCMLVIYRFQVVSQPMTWPHRIQLLVAGMAGIGVYNICLNMGELSVSAGIASFVIGLMPVLTVFLSFLFLKERLNLKSWGGLLLSLMGLAVLALGEGGGSDLHDGVLLILVSTLMGAILTIVQKKLLTRYHPVAITAWVMWGGTLLLLIFAPDLYAEIREADVSSTVSAVYMGVFPAAVAYLAWSYVLKHVSAPRAAIALYALPLASTLLGFLFLHEIPSLMSLFGGGIALVGAFVAHYFENLQKAMR